MSNPQLLNNCLRNSTRLAPINPKMTDAEPGYGPVVNITSTQ